MAEKESVAGTLCARQYRLAVVVSHPIQYLSPWFRALARRVDLEVAYAHRQDAAGQANAGFGVKFDWDIPLLDGYRYRWLRNLARKPGLTSFTGCDTPEISNMIAQGNFDAALVFGWNRKSCIQAIRACRRHGVPVLMRGDSQLRTPRSVLRAGLKYLPYRWLLLQMDGHLYVGQRNRQYLRHYGAPESRLFFAPHFVDNAFFACRAEESRERGDHLALRRQFGIPPDAFVFLFVGKLVPKKRPDDFLRACKRAFVMPGGTNMHALVVGDGPLRSGLERQAQRHRARIHFAGFRNQTELPAIYAAGDALVLPSDGNETWGLVVNEAMAAGLPAIVSEAAGCAPDLIDTGSTGFIHPEGDIETLGCRLLDVANLMRSDADKVRAALASKMTEYSLDRATQGLERALRQVCQGPYGSAAVSTPS